MIGRRGTPSTAEEQKPKGFDDYELRLGDLMRGERATLGKSLLDVQRELKIKATYVAAIENCDVSAFETQGFVAGYVRSYARYLGMDPEWAFTRFREEADFAPPQGISAVPAAGRGAAANSVARPKVGSGARPKAEYRDPLANPNATFIPRTPALFSGIEPRAVGSVLVLLALIGVIGYGAWSVLQQVQRVQLAPVDQAPGAVADVDPLASLNDTSKTAKLSVPAADKLDRLYRPKALEVPVMVARDGPIASIKPGSLGALAPDVDDAAALAADGQAPAAGVDPAPASADAAAQAAQQAVAQVAAADPQAKPGQVRVTADAAPDVQIVALRPAWVRVRASDGTVLFEKVLDAGEHYKVPASAEPATLRAGNSGAVYFTVDGKTYGPAAKGAQVVKNVALTVKNLTQSYKLADLSSDPKLASMVAVAQVQTDHTK